MLTKRILLTIAAAAFLTACSNITEIERTQQYTGPLKLNAVIVDVSDLDLSTEGRPITRTSTQVQEDLRRAIVAEAQKRSVPDGLPANINVKVEKIFLARIIDRTLAGTSFVESEISVTDAETDAFLVEPVDVRATSEQLRAAGAIGAVVGATTTPTADYEGVINAYAKALVESLEASS